MCSAAIGILGGYIILHGIYDRYATGYEQLEYSNPSLKECSDSLAWINDEAIGELKTFKDRILSVLIFSCIIFVLDVLRSILTCIIILPT